jgi:hypothetical protein
VAEDDRREPDLRWPNDEKAGAEPGQHRGEKSSLDELPYGAMTDHAIVGGFFVDRVRRWRERLRRRREASLSPRD